MTPHVGTVLAQWAYTAADACGLVAAVRSRSRQAFFPPFTYSQSFEANMSLQYSDARLYTQLRYYVHLFDVWKPIADIEKLDKTKQDMPSTKDQLQRASFFQVTMSWNKLTKSIWNVQD